MKVVVASKNPVKIETSREAFSMLFPTEELIIEGISAPSGVSDQPMSDSETFDGAKNRADNASTAVEDGDYWVGIEGGIEEKNGELEVFAWVIIKSSNGSYGKGRSATFFLPPVFTKGILVEGKELGDISDEIFDEKNSKQKQGTIGILSKDTMSRSKYYLDPLICALLPFVNEDLYRQK